MQKLALPYKGVNRGAAVVVTPSEFSTNMNNVRPRDILEKRIRLGQRPGLAKWSDDQIGDVDQPIVFLLSVSSVT